MGMKTGDKTTPRKTFQRSALSDRIAAYIDNQVRLKVESGKQPQLKNTISS